MRVAVAVSFCVTFLGVVAGFVILTLAGKDVLSLVMFVSGAATTLFPQLMSYLKMHDTAQDVKTLQSDMATVKEQTNGPLSKMSEQVNTIASRVGGENGDKN